MIKDVQKKEHLHKKVKLASKCLCVLIPFVLGYIAVILENNIACRVNITPEPIYLILCGFLMSGGIIVPGVSSTVILMIMGIYSIYLNAISNMDVTILTPLGIGVLIGSIIWIKITKYLFTNHYTKTFYSIVGFTLRKYICTSA